MYLKGIPCLIEVIENDLLLSSLIFELKRDTQHTREVQDGCGLYFIHSFRQLYCSFCFADKWRAARKRWTGVDNQALENRSKGASLGKGGWWWWWRRRRRRGWAMEKLQERNWEETWNGDCVCVWEKETERPPKSSHRGLCQFIGVRLSFGPGCILHVTIFSE